MDLKELFKFAGTKNELEQTGNHTVSHRPKTSVGGIKCPKCESVSPAETLRRNMYICPVCGAYLSIKARERIRLIADEGSFIEHDKKVVTENRIGFPGYDEKLDAAKKSSGEIEGVVCGTIRIAMRRCAVFSMESRFMMGSMGSAVGDKITRLFEYATRQGLPVIGITVSGGARMQEGIVSLMQMAKVSGAVKRHSDAGLLYTVLLTNPTTGGVTASFAMLGDIIAAEPGALIGFAGPRVIEQTIRKKLPEGFQSAEAMMKCGFVDTIVSRDETRAFFSTVLELHGYKKEDEA